MRKLLFYALIFIYGINAHAQEKIQTENGLKSDFIYKNGNIGIGVSPSWKLDIQGAGTKSGIHLKKTDAVTASWYLHPGRLGKGEFTIGDDSQYRLTILANGNIGIGTTNPSSKLSVYGDIAKLTTTGYDNTFDNFIKYGHKSDLESGTAKVNRWHGIDATITAGSASSNKMKFRLYGGGYGNEAPIDVMTLTGSGRVGIGTINPQSELAVNGTITSKEVKVTLDGWSDFVFNNDYKLIDLEDVEIFISKNNRLPDIPSKTEVVENGINLGEMDAKLLQKIEELTLYMIDMNQRMKSVEAENKSLKKEVNILKAL